MTLWNPLPNKNLEEVGKERKRSNSKAAEETPILDFPGKPRASHNPATHVPFPPGEDKDGQCCRVVGPMRSRLPTRR